MINASSRTDRIIECIENTTIEVIYQSFRSITMGYTYGRLAYLPAISIAKAFTVWGAVETLFMMMAKPLIKDYRIRKITNATIILLTGAISIQQMVVGGLLGDKMLAVLLISLIFRSCLCLHEAVNNKPSYDDQYINPLQRIVHIMLMII